MDYNENEIRLIESEFSNRERTEIIDKIYQLWQGFARDSKATQSLAKASLTLADTLAPEYKPQYQGKIIWNRISSELCFSYDESGHYILDSVLSGGHEITITDTKELDS